MGISRSTFTALLCFFKSRLGFNPQNAAVTMKLVHICAVTFAEIIVFTSLIVDNKVHTSILVFQTVVELHKKWPTSCRYLLHPLLMMFSLFVLSPL